MARAIALLSGGLDSTLAVLLMRRQGVEVTAVTFLTHFGCDAGDTSSCSADSTHNAVKYGFEVKLSHLAEKFIGIVKNPKHGHGRNMNPCIDCRILMLREAGQLMKMRRADFVVTGEVLGQRPMSQRKETFPLLDREAGLSGLVLRPLSAKLMKPTLPEEKGLVDRDMLCGFSGRTRKPQIALASEFGLSDYPNPAGGCLLTDPIFSFRLRELLAHVPDASFEDFNLLRLGRHFRLESGTKIIVGRDESENARLLQIAGSSGDYALSVTTHGSPTTIIRGNASEADIRDAARITARYSDAKRLSLVNVQVLRAGAEFNIAAEPAKDDFLSEFRIEKKPAEVKAL